MEGVFSFDGRPVTVYSGDRRDFCRRGVAWRNHYQKRVMFAGIALFSSGRLRKGYAWTSTTSYSGCANRTCLLMPNEKLARPPRRFPQFAKPALTSLCVRSEKMLLRKTRHSILAWGSTWLFAGTV
jgi:hypothetical protein